MFVYEKRLQYPINIKTTSATLANAIVTQLGGPDGELGAAMRYLNQRFTMPYNEVAGVLTDIGREAPEMFRGSRPSAKPISIAATDMPLTEGRGHYHSQGLTLFAAV